MTAICSRKAELVEIANLVGIQPIDLNHGVVSSNTFPNNCEQFLLPIHPMVWIQPIIFLKENYFCVIQSVYEQDVIVNDT